MTSIALSHSTPCAFCCILFLVTSAPTYAQVEDRIWIGTGLGLGAMVEKKTNDDEPGAGTGALYASYQTGVHVFSLRTVVVTEVFGDTGGDVGVLYGRATTGPNSHASFGIGLAVVFVDYNPDGLNLCGLFGSRDDCPARGRDENVLAFGVPVEVQLFWRPLAFVGLGVYGFANLNPEAPFAGLALGLQLGDLR